MNVIVTLTYEDTDQDDKDVTLSMSDRLQGGAILNAIERKLNSKAYATDPWTRWILKEICR